MGVNKYIELSKLRRIVIPLFFYALFVGCTNTVEPNFADFGFEYYPTTIGDYRVYHTSTIRYNLNGTIDSATYLVKEVAEDSITYADGTSKIVLGRYSADIGTNDWQKDSLWAVLIDHAKVVVSEANVDFIKLVFPKSNGKEWDGNGLNSAESEFYKMEEIGTSYGYDTLTYENTLTVIHKDLVDPVKITADDYRIEVFAANVGLIHKLNIKLNYCSSCVENGKIDDGFIFEQKLIEIGKE